MRELVILQKQSCATIAAPCLVKLTGRKAFVFKKKQFWANLKYEVTSLLKVYEALSPQTC